MPDELKRADAPAYREVARSPKPKADAPSDLSTQASDDVNGGSTAQDRLSWFEAIGPGTTTPPPPRKSYSAAALALLAIVLACFGKGVLLKLGLPIGLGLASLLLVIRNARRASAARQRARRRGLGLEVTERRDAPPSSGTFTTINRNSSKRWGVRADEPRSPPIPPGESAGTDASAEAAVSLDASTPPGRLLFKAPGADEAQTLLCTSEPFGVTLLSTPLRDRAAMMLTSNAGTFCVGASFDAAARRLFASLFERAFTVTRDEAGLDAIGPDGEPILLPPEAFASLVEALTQLDRICLDRFVLTDVHGAPLLLEPRELRIGEHVFDLEAPLEWRGLVFQEGFGQSIAVYQGTWIRQGTAEVVLVSLLPSLASVGPSSITEGAPLASLDRSVLRDLRLMQASPESPPPNEQRVAIERLFMLPLRHALDRAPRPLTPTVLRCKQRPAV